MNKGERIGVYGGTFDPIHRTHLSIARTALAHAALDRVLFVVSACPPHKQDEVFAQAEDRFALVQAAVAGDPHMEACRIELDREGPSYTADTLAALHQIYPESALFLIVGYDSLLDIPRWYNPKGVLDHARLLVAPRPGIPAQVPKSVEDHYEMLPFTESEVSSTDIRARIAAALPVKDLLPEAVERLIRQKGLYHADRLPPET